jgi:formate dehydrogenase subunit gamma
VDHIRETLGAGPGARSADGRIDVEPVFCFGRCALAPVVTIDGSPHGRMTEARADGLLEGLD